MVGLDLGSARLRVVLAGRGLVLESSAVLARRDTPTGPVVIATGDAALLQARVPDTEVLRPVRDGAVVSWSALEDLVRSALATANTAGWRRPSVLVALPADANETEVRAWTGSLVNAGARQARWVPAPIAAAVGARLPVTEPTGSLIISLGAGTFEVAVLCFGAAVARSTLRLGGDDLLRKVIAWSRRHADILLDDAGALRALWAAGLQSSNHGIRLDGRSLHDGRTTSVDVGSAGIADALRDTVARLVDTTIETVRRCPPEICADLAHTGALLVGGFARLPGLSGVLSDALQIPAIAADEPEHAVARGLERLLAEPALLELCAGRIA